MDKSNISIDPENLICSIKEKPLPELPPETQICVNLWDQYWNYIGYTSRKLSDADCLGPYDLYNDITIYPKKNELLSIKKVIIHFYFQYKCYDWDFFISQPYPFDPQKFY